MSVINERSNNDIEEYMEWERVIIWYRYHDWYYRLYEYIKNKQILSVLYDYNKNELTKHIIINYIINNLLIC